MVKNSTPNAGDAASIPGQGTRSYMHATTKNSHATTKTRHNQKKKKKKDGKLVLGRHHSVLERDGLRK